MAGNGTIVRPPKLDRKRRIDWAPGAPQPILPGRSLARSSSCRGTGSSRPNSQGHVPARTRLRGDKTSSWRAWLPGRVSEVGEHRLARVLSALHKGSLICAATDWAGSWQVVMCAIEEYVAPSPDTRTICLPVCSYYWNHIVESLFASLHHAGVVGTLVARRTDMHVIQYTRTPWSVDPSSSTAEDMVSRRPPRTGAQRLSELGCRSRV